MFVVIRKPERQKRAACEPIGSLQDAKDIDPSAWPVFLERLTRYVAARVPPRTRDDVVGEILLKLVQHRQKLAAARDPLAWIKRVAANAVTDHHRRCASEQRAMVAYASDALLSDGRDERQMPTASSSDGIVACVLPFMNQLPPPYRDALKLIDIDGLSQKAAATKAGLSASGMKSRVQRGRRKLKEAILQCCAVQLDRRGEIMAYQPRGETSEKQCCAHGT